MYGEEVDVDGEEEEEGVVDGGEEEEDGGSSDEGTWRVRVRSFHIGGAK